MAEVRIKIKEPVMINGRHCAQKEVVTVNVDDAAVVVGMGRADYVKADQKPAKIAKTKSGSQDGQTQGGDEGDQGDEGEAGAGGGQ